ncbi:MAG: discoidin domain-containing protein [Verrucomicrobiota bacterium]
MKKQLRNQIITQVLVGCMLFMAAAGNWAVAASSRTVMPLDGTWQVAEGSMEKPTSAFDRTVPVPGLVTLATPSFDKPGPEVMNRCSRSQKDPKRDAFWYRRTFKLEGSIPEVAQIKVFKAMFGTQVTLNGKLLGVHEPCFTPGYFDAKPALKSGENEIVIRVGADRDAVGRSRPDGKDCEKVRYIPGIFDSVELILAGTPFIQNVQVAPDIAQGKARVRIELSAAGEVSLEAREAKSGKMVGKGQAKAEGKVIDTVVAIEKCRLWSPEDPFLYEMKVRTAADEVSVRFGMREFHFDPKAGRAMLNGKPYFMRGSNFVLYRFFEDSECRGLPWNEAWVRKLHQKVKDMHWNCLRYSIGFPPEAWYRIADEEGILIDDEFPVWFANEMPPQLSSEELQREYEEWMRERWNHPCVVIWDACNETRSPKTGEAIKKVRGLDLSNRPWDNGWSYPQEPGDMMELHAYNYCAYAMCLSKMGQMTKVPPESDGKHAIVINEYGWHWVNRDGTPTQLTYYLYGSLVGLDATPQQRFHMQAAILATTTEFWRVNRKVAAVMHFHSLGNSRPNGATSDHWKPGRVADLEWEPEFYRYVRDSFAPVGLMLDFWSERVSPGESRKIPVMLVNDLEKPWSGPVVLRVKRGDQVLFEKSQEAHMESFGTANLVFDMVWPAECGSCVLEAELTGADGQPVHSVRDTAIQPPPPVSLAAGRPATASAVARPYLSAKNAVDNDPLTYWSSGPQDRAWLAVDLGAEKTFRRVRINWEFAFATSYSVQVSSDGQQWREVFSTNQGKYGVTDIPLEPVTARHVRVEGIKNAKKEGRSNREGYGIYELEVFE